MDGRFKPLSTASDADGHESRFILPWARQGLQIGARLGEFVKFVGQVEIDLELCHGLLRLLQ